MYAIGVPGISGFMLHMIGFKYMEGCRLVYCGIYRVLLAAFRGGEIESVGRIKALAK